MIEIKKYSNRRLYNTETSEYVTQEDIVDLIKKNQKFRIIDSESKKNITSSILLQIILERENSGTNVIPEDFLKQIILFYENNKSSDMFYFLNNINNFADPNNIFAEGMSSLMKFSPFDFNKYYNSNFSNKKNETKEKTSENNIPKEKTSNNNQQNIDDLVFQINKLKDQVEEIKKKTD
jgi:polyhydroxyalkanoate synthesis repressor PhaR|tara:strand:- start:211 stop:747 length:537 start_codon:yes stop_codon:yes gene_type:complete